MDERLKSLERKLINFFFEENGKESALLCLARFKKENPQFKESEIRGYIWSLVDRGLLKLDGDRKLVKSYEGIKHIITVTNPKIDRNNLNIREDGRVEYICNHGVGHTLYSPSEDYTHGCDGCCKDLKVCDLSDL
jgi:hypothetical protein